ncbi:MAG: TIGR02270 family protein [Sedimentisphaerales bacterium]|nr:TIGR02270 family protein [Sedimentisphaerales bacterium]
MSIVAVVISQHIEEAAFNWLRRDAAVRAPHYLLKDMAKLDHRVEAHLDGLRIAGGEGWRIVREELTWEEAGEVFAGGVLAFESGEQERIELVLKVGTQSVELARGVISALGWLPLEKARPYIERLLEAAEPMRRRIGIGAAGVHRHDPGPKLDAAIGDPVAVSRAVKAAGELGRLDTTVAVGRLLTSEDPQVRFWAAWSAVLLGDPAGVGVLREIAEAGGPFAERAADLAARRMNPTDALAWQKQLAGQEKWLRLAIKVTGAIGDPALAPWLIELMANPELARPAGEAFASITGVDIAYEDLEGEWPEGFEAGPTEAPEDENVAMDADEDLPWPAPPLIQAWWSKNRGRFPGGQRHLVGRPIAPEALEEVLRTGMQRQRAAAALELALRQPGKPLFEVCARGDRQRQALGLTP